jgi:hypothetical protein
MATSETSVRRWLSLGATAVLLVATVVSLTAAAGGSARSRLARRGVQAPEGQSAGVLSSLAPTPAPRTWTSATIASGAATLFYPSGWKPIPGDRGTVTEALRDSGGLYRGYLNVTPRQGTEQLAGWAAFRTRRNTQEGDKRTHTLATAENLSFTNARGSCVIDDYLSRVASHHYRELACIVTGRRYTNVFIGAALLGDWSELGPVVKRAAAALVVR